jgi:hypothetical protein
MGIGRFWLLPRGWKDNLHQSATTLICHQSPRKMSAQVTLELESSSRLTGEFRSYLQIAELFGLGHAREHLPPNAFEPT